MGLARVCAFCACVFELDRKSAGNSTTNSTFARLEVTLRATCDRVPCVGIDVIRLADKGHPPELVVKRHCLFSRNSNCGLICAAALVAAWDIISFSKVSSNKSGRCAYGAAWFCLLVELHHSLFLHTSNLRLSERQPTDLILCQFILVFELA
jgi:hypothetical protein